MCYRCHQHVFHHHQHHRSHHQHHSCRFLCRLHRHQRAGHEPGLHRLLAGGIGNGLWRHGAGQGRDAGFSGKYQQGDDLDEIISSWTPQQMLPRAYKDNRKLPEAIKGLKAR